MLKNMTFGQRMRQLRAEKDMSQNDMAVDFAQRMGQIITKSGISYYESDKRIPENKTLVALAEYFGVSIDYLLARTDDRKATVKADDGLKEDNILFKSYSDIYDQLRRRLVEEKVIGELDDLPPTVMKLFFALGEDAALRILRSKGIDEGLIAALIADHRF